MEEKHHILFRKNGIYNVDIRIFNPSMWFWLRKAPQITKSVFLESLEGIYPFSGDLFLNELTNWIKYDKTG